MSHDRYREVDIDPVEHNMEIAGETAGEFVGKLTEPGSKEAIAATAAAKEFTKKHPVPKKGMRGAWAAGLMAFITVAVTGCEENQEDDVLTRNVAALADDVRTSHVTSGEVGRRAERDIARVRQSFESTERNRAIARSVLDQARPQGSFDLHFVESHDGAHGEAEYLYSLVDERANEQVRDLIWSEGLYIPEARLSTLKHSLRSKIVLAMSSILNGEATALDVVDTHLSDFTRSVRDELMSAERMHTENYAAY